jgi:cell division protein FtsQ
LQQTGTGADIWQRATPAPAPRSASLRRRQAKVDRRAARRTRVALALAAATVGAAAALGHIGGAERVSRASMLGWLERLAETSGFGLQQVAVTGQRFTADGDIFDALDLGATRTLLGLNSRAAQARIEALPWVESASLERVFPDRLNITIVEREAFAIWQLGARYYLIDRSGRRLGALPAHALPALRRVAGEGAASEAAELFAALGRQPVLLARLEVAERIGGRRWTLRLAGGVAIHLPPDADAATLARASDLLGGARASMGSTIDLRVAGRILLRGKGTTTAERVAPAPQPPDRI